MQVSQNMQQDIFAKDVVIRLICTRSVALGAPVAMDKCKPGGAQFPYSCLLGNVVPQLSEALKLKEWKLVEHIVVEIIRSNAPTLQRVTLRRATRNAHWARKISLRLLRRNFNTLPFVLRISIFWPCSQASGAWDATAD